MEKQDKSLMESFIDRSITSPNMNGSNMTANVLDNNRTEQLGAYGFPNIVAKDLTNN